MSRTYIDTSITCEHLHVLRRQIFAIYLEFFEGKKHLLRTRLMLKECYLVLFFFVIDEIFRSLGMETVFLSLDIGNENHIAYWCPSNNFMPQ
jgi:hypothetical protein